MVNSRRFNLLHPPRLLPSRLALLLSLAGRGQCLMSEYGKYIIVNDIIKAFKIFYSITRLPKLITQGPQLHRQPSDITLPTSREIEQRSRSAGKESGVPRPHKLNSLFVSPTSRLSFMFVDFGGVFHRTSFLKNIVSTQAEW